MTWPQERSEPRRKVRSEHVGTSNQLFRIEPREVFRAPRPSLGSVLFLLLGIEFQSIWFRKSVLSWAEDLGDPELIQIIKDAIK